ncbi:uncharacterized protein [Typha angustifolia]|uniref:uncharacterized protein n=1 Tax=Typha angustifolia TaxID=59011 RepID=UPI003C2E9D00
MDGTVAAGFGDKDANNAIQKAMEGKKNETEIKDPPSQDRDATKSTGYHDMESVNWKAMNEAADVNMEAAITTDDVLRAGGFGSRDDIGSLLPAAIDSTDFEASLRDARDFEEEQAETSRPGLGWTKHIDEQQG